MEGKEVINIWDLMSLKAAGQITKQQYNEQLKLLKVSDGGEYWDLY